MHTLLAILLATAPPQIDAPDTMARGDTEVVVVSSEASLVIVAIYYGSEGPEVSRQTIRLDGAAPPPDDPGDDDGGDDGDPPGDESVSEAAKRLLDKHVSDEDLSQGQSDMAVILLEIIRSKPTTMAEMLDALQSADAPDGWDEFVDAIDADLRARTRKSPWTIDRMREAFVEILAVISRRSSKLSAWQYKTKLQVHHNYRLMLAEGVRGNAQYDRLDELNRSTLTDKQYAYARRLMATAAKKDGRSR